MAENTSYDGAIAIGQKLAKENSTVTETVTKSSPTVVVEDTKPAKK